LVFDLENRLSGEVHAKVNRGWVISDGGNATFTLTDDEALLPCMQLGRMIYIDGAGEVPNWAGMIDTPWAAVSPVTVTAYEVPYLLSRRCAYFSDIRVGDTREVALRFVDLANMLGDTFIREGSIQTGDADRSVPVDSTPDWEQLKKLVANAGMEMMFRSELDSEHRLVHYIDIQKLLGVMTQVVLQDGEGANMKINQGALDGEIWNAVMGVNNASTSAGEIHSDKVIDQESVDLYRARNKVAQFNTGSKSALQTYTENFVAANGKPMVTLGVSIKDNPPLFSQLRLGNVVKVRATQLILPGGRRGWSGFGRILGMTYDEGLNQVTMALVGAL
jgi:hypothetical protein